MLAYPNFSEEFIIHTDASAIQLGGVITQNDKPLAFFSRKLLESQQSYTTTERELLSIVELIKEYRNMLLGQKIIVYTDHKNLLYVNTTSPERVMRWRLILEEYGVELRYIKGDGNIVADSLSRMTITKMSKKTIQHKEAIKHLNSLRIVTSNSKHVDINPKTTLRNDVNSTLLNHIYFYSKI